MHDCMGFRMLRVSDPRHSDALVFEGGGFPHALLHGVSHAAGLRPAVTPMGLFVGEVFPCMTAWGFACCGSPTRVYSDVLVFEGCGLRPASTPTRLFLRAVVSDPRLLRCAVVARL